MHTHTVTRTHTHTHTLKKKLAFTKLVVYAVRYALMHTHARVHTVNTHTVTHTQSLPITHLTFSNFMKLASTARMGVGK